MAGSRWQVKSLGVYDYSTYGKCMRGASLGGKEVKKRGNERDQEGVTMSERIQYTRGGEGRDGRVLTCVGVWHLQATTSHMRPRVRFQVRRYEESKSCFENSRPLPWFQWLMDASLPSL